MKAVCKKLLSLMLVAILLVSAVPFQTLAAETDETVSAEEITATSPEAYAGVALDKDAVLVDFQLAADEALGVETTYRVDKVNAKIGGTASTPKGSTALSVLKKALGTVDGIEFVRWYYLKDGVKTTFTSSVVLNRDNMEWDSRDENEDGEEYDYLDVYAEFQYVPANITLKADGGTVASSKHKVMVGMTYGEYGSLPTPKKSGYEFLGWYKADGELVTDESVVTSMGSLTAKWAAGKYTVTYKGFTGSDWEEVGFGSFTVDNNSVLKTSYNNFPTDAQIKSLFALSGWTIDGWEYSNDDEATWKTFTAGTTKITGTTTIRPLYKKNITLYACDTGNTTRSLSVTLGKNYPALPHPGTREGYAFIGWYTESEGAGDLVSSKANLSVVSAHPIVDTDVSALYANWDPAKTVYLYIYTNGETEEHAKLVRYYDVPESGFDLTDIDLYSIFANYGKYDDNGDEKYGWYDNAQWKNYCMGKHINDTTEYVVPGSIEDDVLEYHIMLIDNGNNTAASGSTNGTGYNDNSTTVDSSNPSTGDSIFVFVTIMAVSACAVLLMFMNKKRIVK